MNSFAALSQSDDILDPKDVTFFKFTGLVPDAKVAVQKEPFDVEKYPASVSLIACASKHGYFAAATTQGFTFGTTKSLRKAFYSADKGGTVELEQDNISVSVDKPVRQIRFSADESQLLIATEGGNILNYNVSDINTSKNAVRPIHTFALNQEIADLRPNPEALPNLAAVLFNNNQCEIIDITNGNTECEIPIDNVSAICWSPKGKQIVCGKLDGSLQHFDTQGTSKDNLPIPESMSAGHGDEEENRNVQDVLWIENHIFLVLYARKRLNEEDEYLNDGFIINRKPSNGSNEPLYTRLAEITPIFTTEGRGNHFYMEVIRDLGKEIKHLVIIANAATNELSVVGHTEDGEWATWMLPENGTANLPLSEETSMDTYPLGLALDLSPDEKLPPIDASENEAGVEPMPIFYYINDEGHIGSYHCYNIELARRGESYNAFSSSEASAAATASTTSAPTQAPAQAPTQTPSAFSSLNTTSGSSFGDLLSGKVTSPTTTPSGGFGSGGFGGFGGFGSAPDGNIPSFSNLGSAQKIPAVPSSGFATINKAASNTAVPQFGSTTSFGLAASQPGSTSSAINKPLSAFGNTSKTDQTVPESSTEAPKSAFGTAPTNTTPSKDNVVPTSSTPTSAFGSTSSVGSGSFGSLSQTAAPKASPAFGSTSSMGTGGGFGSLAKNTVPGATAPSASPAFGSTSSIGGSFASLSMNTAAGATTPKSSPSFGSTSSVGSGGGFGSLAKNTVPGATAPSASPAFGSTSTLGTGGGFGSLAKNTVPGATTPNASPAFGSTSTVGSGGFGSPAKNTAPGATSPAASPAFGSTSSFGSGSGFGSFGKDATTTTPPAFGSTSTVGGGFGSLAKNTVPGATAPSFGSTTSLGSGGFGSLAKNTVPGATTPSFGTTNTLGSGTGFGALNKPSAPSTPPATSTNPVTTPKPAEASKATPPSTTTTTTAPAVTSPTPSSVAPPSVSLAKPVVSPSTPSAKPTETKITSPPKSKESESVAPKEKLKPTAEEGMAREYESLYIAVCEAIEELSEIHKKIELATKANNLATGSKTEADLMNKDCLWNLNDVADYATLTQKILDNISKDEKDQKRVLETLETLAINSKKAMDKKDDIKYLLKKEFDTKVVDLMDNRELDAETKDVLTTLESRSLAYESTLKSLELKVQDDKKRNKIKIDHNSGELTLYSLHRSIRDIQREISARNNDLADLEERLANIKLNESRRRARQSTGGFSCEDLSDDEEDEEQLGVSNEAIQHTTRYLRRFNFLAEMSDKARARTPLECVTDNS